MRMNPSFYYQIKVPGMKHVIGSLTTMDTPRGAKQQQEERLVSLCGNIKHLLYLTSDIEPSSPPLWLSNKPPCFSRFIFQHYCEVVAFTERSCCHRSTFLSNQLSYRFGNLHFCDWTFAGSKGFMYVFSDNAFPRFTLLSASAATTRWSLLGRRTPACSVGATDSPATESRTASPCAASPPVRRALSPLGPFHFDFAASRVFGMCLVFFFLLLRLQPDVHHPRRSHDHQHQGDSGHTQLPG